MTLPLWNLLFMDRMHFQCPGPSPTLRSLGPFHQCVKCQVSLWGSPCAFGAWALFMERCAKGVEHISYCWSDDDLDNFDVWWNKTNENKRVLAHLSKWSAQNIMGTRGTLSDTRDLWCRWWENPSDSNVGRGPWHWERLPPRRLGLTRARPWTISSLWHLVLDCLKTSQSEVWARRYGNLSGALSRDNALESSGLGVGPRTMEV